VVQILTQLGVTMVSEDPETYDIHADIVGGWPPVVNPVIQVLDQITVICSVRVGVTSNLNPNTV
jgi:hypothetical protein